MIALTERQIRLMDCCINECSIYTSPYSKENTTYPQEIEFVTNYCRVLKVDNDWKRLIELGFVAKRYNNYGAIFFILTEKGIEHLSQQYQKYIKPEVPFYADQHRVELFFSSSRVDDFVIDINLTESEFEALKQLGHNYLNGSNLKKMLDSYSEYSLENKMFPHPEFNFLYDKLELKINNFKEKGDCND